MERIRRILTEIHRTLRPGARYAMLELNPDGPAPMMISDSRWPKDVQHGFLRSAGFGNIRCFEPVEGAGTNPPYAIYLAEKKGPDTGQRPAGTVPCGSFGGPLTKSVHAITENCNPS